MDSTRATALLLGILCHTVWTYMPVYARAPIIDVRYFPDASVFPNCGLLWSDVDRSLREEWFYKAPACPVGCPLARVFHSLETIVCPDLGTRG